jgi:hypothetical protein
LPKFNPQIHSASHQATIDGVSTYGTGAGEVFTAFSGDGHGAVAGVWMPTRLDPDGQPAGSRYFPSTTGSVG